MGIGLDPFSFGSPKGWATLNFRGGKSGKLVETRGAQPGQYGYLEQSGGGVHKFGGGIITWDFPENFSPRCKPTLVGGKGGQEKKNFGGGGVFIRRRTFGAFKSPGSLGKAYEPFWANKFPKGAGLYTLGEE